MAGAAAIGRSALAQDATAVAKTGVDPNKWNIETIRSLAGTIQVDTAAELHAIVPDTVSGDVAFWNNGPVESTPQVQKDLYDQFGEALKTYCAEPECRSPEHRLQRDAGQAAHRGRGRRRARCGQLPILWGVEFAAKGDLQEIKLEDFGYEPRTSGPARSSR